MFSVPDQREYLLDMEADPLETRNFALLDSGESHLKRLRSTLIEQFRKDGYTLPLDGGKWLAYPPAKLPPAEQATSNQDARWTDAYLHVPGYERM